tara:strand:- start:580 stop:1113 length:534 start_codon:yes stop_codon:yes gene_type:complete
MARKNKNIIQKPVELFLDEGVFIPKYVEEELNPKFVKQYEESIPLLRYLTGQDRSLLDFFLKEMNFENTFSTSSYFLKKYISEVGNGDFQEKLPSPAGLKKNIKRLHASGIILSFQRGVKIVNPKYFFRGSEEERSQLLQEIYQKQLNMKAEEMTKEMNEEEVLNPEVEEYLNCQIK